MPCIGCRSNSIVRDDVSGNFVCEQCGTLQQYDNYDPQLGGLQGPQGTSIRIGSVGTGSFFNYKEKKIFEANKLIDEILFNLDLRNGSKAGDIKNMIENITDGEFGQGDWFPVLIGACCYVVMRGDNRVLPITEIAAVIGCDDRELGRMITRVVKFLGLRLPEFDLVESFERAVRNSPSIRRLERDKVERIRGQGVFLMNCAVKWFLSTGRKPQPLVAAVLVFVTELNEVGIGIEEVAKELQVVVSTCRKRYKELLERLVKVAQEGLLWGKDVTVKNIMNHAQSVISFLEARSMKKPREEGNELERVGFDLEDVINECLSKDVGYQYGDDTDSVENESPYFEVREKGGSGSLGVNDVERLRISHECLSMIYMKFANEVDGGNLTGESAKVNGRRKRRGFQLDMCRDWWNGKSEMSKKLLLKQILEKDVGPDVMPPSYIKGCMAVERRREKMKAAKLRINKIMHPSDTDSSNFCSLDCVNTGKKRRRTRVSDIDWEDLIIETLLLRQVKEEEIESGHYNTLMALHVFNSGIV